MWYMNTLQYLAMKRNELLTYIATQADLRIIVQTERIQTKNSMCFMIPLT